jgi:hypothetical protein
MRRSYLKGRQNLMMRNLLKKWFDWTPRDVAQWEAIRQRGLGRFLLWYSALFAGGLFALLGGAALILWLVQTVGKGVTGARLTYLGVQLLFLALVCLAGGLVNSLITWVVEERLYPKYKSLASQGNADDHTEMP